MPAEACWLGCEGSDDWVYLGSLHFVEEAGLSMSDRLQQAYREALDEGHPAAFVGWDGRVQGAVRLLRNAAPGANELLRTCESRDWSVSCSPAIIGSGPEP